MTRRRVVAATVVACTAAMSVLAMPALAHEERKAIFPTGKGHWIQQPRPYSGSRPHIVVCQPDSAQRIASIKNATKRSFNQQLLPQCKYHSIQLAVNAVKHQGTDVWLLPGLYTESQYDGLPK